MNKTAWMAKKYGTLKGTDWKEDLKKGLTIMMRSEQFFSLAGLIKSLPKNNKPKEDFKNILGNCSYDEGQALEKYGVPGYMLGQRYGHRFRYDNNTTSDYQWMLKDAQKYYEELVEDEKINKQYYIEKSANIKKRLRIELNDNEKALIGTGDNRAVLKAIREGFKKNG